MQQMTIAKIRFTLRVVFIHTVTYILCGLLFHQLFDYRAMFDLEIIGSFMRPVSDPWTMLGPWLQPVRGLLFALGLWLLRPAWAGKKHGWLVVWAVIFLFGIVNTPAAAPSSIEGVIYSRLPLWYHGMGYAEVGLQTLAFSVLVFAYERRGGEGAGFWRRHPRVAAVVRAVAISCLAYIGYAAASIAVLFLSGGTLEFREAAVLVRTGGEAVNIERLAGDLTIQFMFLTVFVLNVAFILLYSAFLEKKRVPAPLLAAIVMAVNAAGLFVYRLIAGQPMPVWAMLLMALPPSLIIAVCLKKGVFAAGEK